MKLLFDARYIRTDHHDGISRYTASLLGALKTLIDTGDEAAADLDLTMIISDERQLEMLPDLPHVKICSPTGPLDQLGQHRAVQVGRGCGIGLDQLEDARVGDEAALDDLGHSRDEIGARQGAQRLEGRAARNGGHAPRRARSAAAHRVPPPHGRPRR